MDTPIDTCVDDICGGGGDAMVVTTDVDDPFLGQDEESRELCFSWVADYESRTIIGSDGDRTVLPSPPSKNGNVAPMTQKQISRAENTRPPTKVDNFNDLFSPSRPTVAISHPSNAMLPTDKDRGLVGVEIEREQRLQDLVELIRAEPGVRPKERKKRELWTDDEQKLFLMGSMIFNGKWRNIRKHFVRTKSSSQFGSHVQKFRKRNDQPVANRKRCTVNDITVGDITREDVVRLAPKEWQLAILSTMAACSNGGDAALQENNSGCSGRAQLLPFVPVVQETVKNPSAPIVQPASSIACASSNPGRTPVQPVSSFASFVDGRQTRLVQPPTHPHLGATYLGYPSSTNFFHFNL